jgi:anthranilate phosphoribosyltransferase
MTQHRWTELLDALMAGRDLTRDDAYWAMSEVIGGEVTPVRLAAFLIALRAKGETADEVAGAASALLAQAEPVTIAGTTIDLVGTGGDGLGVVNLATIAAVVVASTGLTVVKHGGRAASSQAAGSGDVIEQLGQPLNLTPAQARAIALGAGIVYLFAPCFHTGMRHAASVRRELGVPTIFNVLGPLLNPARPTHQLVGVASSRFVGVIAEVLAARGTNALVVRGDDGLDKLTVTTTSRALEVRAGRVNAHVIDPRRFGLPLADIGALRGGDAAANADVVRSVLAGQRGPIRDAVLLNAGAAYATVTGSGDLEDRIADGIARCADAIDSGASRATLKRWIDYGRLG